MKTVKVKMVCVATFEVSDDVSYEDWIAKMKSLQSSITKTTRNHGAKRAVTSRNWESLTKREDGSTAGFLHRSDMDGQKDKG